MLSSNTIKVIKSTVPVLEEHGVAITKRFYQLLFTNHPELLHVFNHANQMQGRQQMALANAVYAAAVHIDNLEAILPVVKQIGHKHRSLGIKPESYPIVGENLLKAIKDVLGEAATEEIIEAWAEAYGVIADAFISVEAEMYDQAEKQEGGWKDYREFIVERVEKESQAITSFYLVPQDGQDMATYQPGQYVSVKLSIPGNEYTHIRQYSLSDAPGKPYYRISVKREAAQDERPEGIVSTYLHQSVKVGDTLLLSAPAGDFTLNTESDRPVVLLSGGVGFTPLLSMLKHAVVTQPERDILYIHSALNSEVHGMKGTVEALASEYKQLKAYTCYEQPTVEDRAADNYDKEGFVDAQWLETILPLSSTDAEYYLCGPRPYMKEVYRVLKELKVPVENIHYELFGPAESLE